MIDLKRAAHQVCTDGLFGSVYHDLLAHAGKGSLTPGEAEELLRLPVFLDAYKQINLECELTNIQQRRLERSPSDPPEAAALKEAFNRSTDRLRALEKYSVKAEDAAWSIWIGSLAVFVMFMIHSVVGLFTEVYREAPWLIYGSYVAVGLAGWRFYLRVMTRHTERHREFLATEQETRRLLESGLSQGFWRESDLF